MFTKEKQLLNSLINLKSFEDAYDDFMKICPYANCGTNLKNSAELKHLANMLQDKHLMPLLIEKLLIEGSPCFHECNLLLYSAVYNDNNDMFPGYEDIEETPILKDIYLSNGGGVAAFAAATAQYWHMQETSNKDTIYDYN